MTVVPCSDFGAGVLFNLNVKPAISSLVASTVTRIPSRTVSSFSHSEPSMKPILARPRPPLRSPGARSDLSVPATVKKADLTISGVIPRALSDIVIVRSSESSVILMSPVLISPIFTAPLTASNAFCRSSLTATSATLAAYILAPSVARILPLLTFISISSEPNCCLEAAEVAVKLGREMISTFFLRTLWYALGLVALFG